MTSRFFLIIWAWISAWGPVSSLAMDNSALFLDIETIGSQNSEALDLGLPPRSCSSNPSFPMDEDCKKLSKKTCEKGSEDDGTGVALGEDALRAKRQKLLESTRAELETAFKKALQGDSKEAKALRKGAVLGFNVEGQCDDKQLTRKCLDFLAEQLSWKGTREIFPQPAGEIKNLKFDFPDEKIRTADDDKVGTATKAAFFNLGSQPGYVKTLGSASQQLQKTLARPSEVAKVEKQIFPKVQKLLVDKINSWVDDPKVRKFMASKISTIKFKGTDCQNLPTRTGRPLSLNPMLVPRSIYNSTDHSFSYCAGDLEGRSEFQIVNEIAKELAAAIDPCQITRASKAGKKSPFQYSDGGDSEKADQEFPIQGLLACLRSKDSVGARRSGDDLIPADDPVPAVQKKAKDNSKIGKKASDDDEPNTREKIRARLAKVILKPEPDPADQGRSADEIQVDLADLWEQMEETMEVLDETDVSMIDIELETQNATEEEANKLADEYEELSEERDEYDIEAQDIWVKIMAKEELLKKKRGELAKIENEKTKKEKARRAARQQKGGSPFCQDEDQIGDAFRKWVGAEILPDYMADRGMSEDQFRKGYSNVYRGTCEQSDSRKNEEKTNPVFFNSQLETKTQVDRLLIVNPRVRKQMNCQKVNAEDRRYCTGKDAKK